MEGIDAVGSCSLSAYDVLCQSAAGRGSAGAAVKSGQLLRQFLDKTHHLQAFPEGMAEAEYRLIFYEVVPVVINIIKIAGMSLGHWKISVQFLGFIMVLGMQMMKERNDNDNR